VPWHWILLQVSLWIRTNKFWTKAMHTLQPKMHSMKTKKKNKGNETTSQGHKGPWISMKKWRDSHKKGCCYSFIIQKFYICLTIVEICYATFEHIKLGLVVHSNVKFGYKSTFFAHVSKETKAFILEKVWLSLSIYQVMNKHKVWVKEIMGHNKDLSRDLFLCE
jgi:hypothetical protein